MLRVKVQLERIMKQIRKQYYKLKLLLHSTPDLTQ